ncbi:MAG TPA: LacI family DNA-binding transcriptional regulator [Streptosporangiaceae bacterium]|jgi:LacI family transcriptional regulator|nr:LacI family DNA-binding transcriptional regulator [Streptosporangiaceae bacterium]
MPRRPTSRDVAVAAGVSQSTVSIVLTGKWPGRVSPHTAQTVREAATRLGYRPNLAARNLRLGQTRTVLLVVPTLANPFFGAVYTGAARVAAEHGFGVVVYPWPDGHGPARSPFSAPHEAIDGVLASSMATEVLADLVGQDTDMGVPLVMLDSDPAGAAPTVNVDVADGMRALVGHLAGLGHRRFWHLAADIDAWTFRVRGRALADAVTALPDGATLVRRTAPITVEGARAATRVWLREAGRVGSDRATALLCDDDVMAAGAYKAARDTGLDIPGDLSITGFDDILLAEAVEPELTTVRLPAQGLGERAMSALLEILDKGRPRGLSLAGELVVRASTAPPRAVRD